METLAANVISPASQEKVDDQDTTSLVTNVIPSTSLEKFDDQETETLAVNIVSPTSLENVEEHSTSHVKSNYIEGRNEPQSRRGHPILKEVNVTRAVDFCRSCQCIHVTEGFISNGSSLLCLRLVMGLPNLITKWEHIEQFYRLDSHEPTLRICSKLTDNHVLKDKINKMKVSHCTQVFSHTVGVLMKRISQWDTRDSNSLPPESADTADLILFLDELFDSLNGRSKSDPASKPLKGCITKNSVHETFWNRSLEVLQSMFYICLIKNKCIKVPSVKNLIFTIKGFLYLRKILLNRNFSYMLTGSFNQDPLENFFSYIRSHGARNTNPDVSHFTTSFKTLLVNNFMSAHSPYSNCEEDINTICLDNLREFLCREYILPEYNQSIV